MRSYIFGGEETVADNPAAILPDRLWRDDNSLAKHYGSRWTAEIGRPELTEPLLQDISRRLGEQRQDIRQRLGAGETIDPLAEFAKHHKTICGPDKDGNTARAVANARVILRNAVVHGDRFFDEDSKSYLYQRVALGEMMCRIGALGSGFSLELSMDDPAGGRRSGPGEARLGTETFGLALVPEEALYDDGAEQAEVATV